jgi:hypothetical protein
MRFKILSCVSYLRIISAVPFHSFSNLTHRYVDVLCVSLYSYFALRHSFRNICMKFWTYKFLTILELCFDNNVLLFFFNFQ